MCATATADPADCRPGDPGYGPGSPGYEECELLPAIDDLEGWRQWMVRRNKAAGVALCRRCDARISPGDAGVVHGTWCGCCESDWLEAEVLIPLVERLGRRKALSALLALARGK